MPDQRLIPLLDENGKLNREVAALMEVKDEQQRSRRPWNRRR
jgi:hypothetical protein